MLIRAYTAYEWQQPINLILTVGAVYSNLSIAASSTDATTISSYPLSRVPVWSLTAWTETRVQGFRLRPFTTKFELTEAGETWLLDNQNKLQQRVSDARPQQQVPMAAGIPDEGITDDDVPF